MDQREVICYRLGNLNRNSPPAHSSGRWENQDQDAGLLWFLVRSLVLPSHSEYVIHFITTGKCNEVYSNADFKLTQNSTDLLLCYKQLISINTDL